MFFAIFLCCLAANANIVSKKVLFTPYELSQKPFWLKNASAQKRLKKREILVSVLSSSKKKSEKTYKTLTLKGVGRVRGDVQGLRKKILRFKELKKIAPGQIKEVSFRSSLSQLYIHGVAMGWHAQMLFQVFEQSPVKEGFRLHWKVISGSFKGMKGFVDLTPVKDSERRSVEFSMTGFYQSERLPLPAFLLRFGLEAVLKVVAQKMRKHLEVVEKSEALPKDVK